MPKLSWDKIIEIVGTEWSAGINVPLDTKAAQFGKQLHNFKVFVGKKEQLINMIKGKDFIGSIIG